MVIKINSIVIMAVSCRFMKDKVVKVGNCDGILQDCLQFIRKIEPSRKKTLLRCVRILRGALEKKQNKTWALLPCPYPT